MQLPSEDELLRRLATGDEKALTILYQQYWQCLFVAAHHVLKDTDACEDIVQEIFLQLWQKRCDLQVRESLKAYLLAAVRYQVFRCLRKKALQQELPLHITEKLQTADPVNDLQHKNLQEQVNAVVAILPEKCRQIYRLSREEELSHKEIALRLQISTKTVENQITIALRRLRHGLEGLVVMLPITLTLNKTAHWVMNCWF